MPDDPIRVDVAGVGVVEFPAGTSESDMKAALDKAADLRTQAPKKGLWETAIGLANAMPGMPHPDDLKKLAAWFPAAGGVVGGIVGGAGGTAFGMGVGGVPGAVGGAALGGAAGESGRQLVNRALGGPAPATAGEAAKAIGTEAALQGGSEAIGGTVIAPIARRIGGVLMQSAVKPSTKETARAILQGVPQANLPIVKTLLAEKANVSRAGIAKLTAIINATNDEIKTVVRGIPGTPISPQRVAGRTIDTLVQAGNQVDPQADVAAVQGVTQRFLEHPQTTRLAQTGTTTQPTGVLNAAGQMITRQAPVMGRVSKNISAETAQTLKEGTYRSLQSRAYGELKRPEVEAQKALARGLKEEVSAEAAKRGIDLTTLNAREGNAIITKEAIADRLAAAGNGDPIAFAWLAANPVHGLLYVAEKSPAVKSMLARGLYNQAAKLSGVSSGVLKAMTTAIAESGEAGQ
jgi:hypothetical protein